MGRRAVWGNASLSLTDKVCHPARRVRSPIRPYPWDCSSYLTKLPHYIPLARV